MSKLDWLGIGHKGGGTIGAIKENEGTVTGRVAATTAGATDGVVTIVAVEDGTGATLRAGRGSGVTPTASVLAFLGGSGSLVCIA